MGEQVTAAEISKLFHMKLSDAAAAMGVGRTVRPTPNAQRPTQRQAPFLLLLARLVRGLATL